MNFHEVDFEINFFQKIKKNVKKNTRVRVRSFPSLWDFELLRGLELGRLDIASTVTMYWRLETNRSADLGQQLLCGLE